MKPCIIFILYFCVGLSSYSNESVPRAAEVKMFLESLDHVKHVRSKDVNSRKWSMWVAIDPALIYVGTRRNKVLSFGIYWWREKKTEESESMTGRFIISLREKLIEKYPKLDLPVAVKSSYMVEGENGAYYPNVYESTRYDMSKHFDETEEPGNGIKSRD